MMVEYMLQDFAKAHDLRYVTCRYFNACGADLESEIGEEHDPETHLIPLILKTMMGERASFSIFGSDYDTDDGTCVRDYIHVQDLANAHVKALEYLNEGNESLELNLGTGSGHSVSEILSAAKKVTGHDIEIKTEARREGDAAILVANPQKSIDTLGFTPHHSDLETIIKSAWDFYHRKK